VKRIEEGGDSFPLLERNPPTEGGKKKRAGRYSGGGLERDKDSVQKIFSRGKAIATSAVVKRKRGQIRSLRKRTNRFFEGKLGEERGSKEECSGSEKNRGIRPPEKKRITSANLIEGEKGGSGRRFFKKEDRGRKNSARHSIKKRPCQLPLGGGKKKATQLRRGNR